MLAPYLPIVVLFVLALAFAAFSVTIAPFVGPRRYNKAKLDFYECGIEPTPQPLGPNRFPIKYFLTAMLFIVFDIETIFLYPYAVSNKMLGLFGLIEIILFIVLVFAAYAYVWRRGGLDWD
jgi:NADH-quinone oxidoreductase subunit A